MKVLGLFLGLVLIGLIVLSGIESSAASISFQDCDHATSVYSGMVYTINGRIDLLFGDQEVSQRVSDESIGGQWRDYIDNIIGARNYLVQNCGYNEATIKKIDNLHQNVIDSIKQYGHRDIISEYLKPQSDSTKNTGSKTDVKKQEIKKTDTKKDTFYQKLNNELQNTDSSYITTDGKTILIVWASNSGIYARDYGVFFSKSTDGGITFSDSKRIDDKQSISISPRSAITGSNIFMTWMNAQYDSTTIMFSKSTDGGKTFSKPQNISGDSKSTAYPKITIDGKNVYVIWLSKQIDPSASYEIFFAKSTDDGKTFSKPQSITNDELRPSFNDIVTDGKSIFVVWSSQGVDGMYIVFVKSIDGGITFNSPQIISGDAKFSLSPPSIAISGSNIFVTWSYLDGNNSNLLFSKSTDGGKTFSKPKNISNNSGSPMGPDIAANGKNVFVNWIDSKSDSSRILSSESNDGGMTFTPPKIIGNDMGFSRQISITTDGKTILNSWTWAEKTDTNQILYFSKYPIELSKDKEKNDQNPLAKTDVKPKATKDVKTEKADKKKIIKSKTKPIKKIKQN